MERIKIDDGSKTYEIVNQEDKVLGTFTFKPTDTNILKRHDELVDTLNGTLKDFEEKPVTTDTIKDAQEIIIRAMDDFIGADTSSTFFSVCGPLTPMANGKLYIEVIMEAIGAVIEKETRKHMKKVETHMNKYLEGYK